MLILIALLLVLILMGVFAAFALSVGPKGHPGYPVEIHAASGVVVYCKTMDPQLRIGHDCVASYTDTHYVIWALGANDSWGQ
jgi:hypothetical protein